MPLFINLLDDNIPRVVSHSASAITNFVESMNSDILGQYVDTILNKIFI